MMWYFVIGFWFALGASAAIALAYVLVIALIGFAVLGAAVTHEIACRVLAWWRRRRRA